MGLFDTLGINMDEIPESGYTNAPDGDYDYEISACEVRKGTKNDPNVLKYVITYGLFENGETQEWFTIAEDGEVTEKAETSLGFLKRRLNDLGVDINEFDPEETDLTGIRGSLQLHTKNGYQNVRNVVAEELEAEEEPEAEEPEDTAAADAALKKQIAAKRAPAKAAPAKTAPAKRPATKRPAASADQENPFE